MNNNKCPYFLPISDFVYDYYNDGAGYCILFRCRTNFNCEEKNSIMNCNNHHRYFIIEKLYHIQRLEKPSSSYLQKFFLLP